ncbi:D-tagatose-bisphosphate aldolase, class II, non-catalytic subunit [Rhodobacteraceae bacterium CCMM004]|nr:D-tagatose-bisphosphate aldolase, class II, non-catalytic subunit [Rhodobacteraceae bacterium CCMM004]
MTHPLQTLVARHRAGDRRGITSVCSAHPAVIEAALRLGARTGETVLIEATCNQVNQDGGYTGMTPADFRRFVLEIAGRVGLDPGRVILGGDHLGPNPWKDLPAEAAMAKAETMIAAYAEAGFTKLHLDTSMGCAGEPAALADAETAARAARLARVAEAAESAADPVYVIGTEVPVPGGATHALSDLAVTTPQAAGATYQVHAEAFRAAGLEAAFSRVIGLVVQPGVEFGHSDVVRYDAAKARALSAALDGLPGAVFEAHSTDYQTPEALRALVGDGFAILKVGPWLTFALREALYALDAVADVLNGTPPQGRLMAEMDQVMQAAPRHWTSHYGGTAQEQWLMRHFSLSDRIRYYWPEPAAERAVTRVAERLRDRPCPAPVLAQFLPWAEAHAGGPLDVQDLLVAAAARVLDTYHTATHAPGA